MLELRIGNMNMFCRKVTAFDNEIAEQYDNSAQNAADSRVIKESSRNSKRKKGLT